MKTVPKISVISPVYNGKNYIANLIKSLNRQKFKDFEFLLIDDGSTDDTVKIANRELKKTKINYKIISQKNGGQSKARNTGIKNARGEWIVMIDSDDTIQTNYLKNMYEVAESNKCDVVICDLNRVNESNIFHETNDLLNFENKNGKEFFEDFILHKIEIGPCSLLINRNYLNDLKLLYNENSRYSEEFIFITHLLHSAKNVVHLKQKLYNYCLRSGSVSTGASVEKVVNGFNKIIESNVLFENCECEYCHVYRKYALARWVLATARFCSKNMNYKKYKRLLDELSYKRYVKKLFDFPDNKIKLASIVLVTCPYVFYFIFRYGGNK